MMSVRRDRELKPSGIDEEEDSQTNPCITSNLSDCGEGRSVKVTEKWASQVTIWGDKCIEGCETCVLSKLKQG
jgi:hypothetical protein